MTLIELASSRDIETMIANMAATLIADFPDEKPLFVALLRGAAPFSSKLMFEIANQSPDFHPEIDYMMVSTYGNERTAGAPHIVTDLAPSTEVAGRTVIVIDDVLDKGITAEFVFAHLASKGAKRTLLAALCQKETTHPRSITADYCGFNFTDEWLVGMGMDDGHTYKESYRWLNSISRIAS